MFDRNDPADLAALKSEVETDPSGYGYVSSDTANVLNNLNVKRNTITVTKEKVSSADIRSTCTYDAYNNLSIDEQEWLRWMTGSNGFNEENVLVTVDLKARLSDGTNAIWAAGNRTEMNAAMLALMDVDGSRAEQLFGFGTVISRDDWLAARDS